MLRHFSDFPRGGRSKSSRTGRQRDKTPGPHDQFGAARLVVLQMRGNLRVDHVALSRYRRRCGLDGERGAQAVKGDANVSHRQLCHRENGICREYLRFRYGKWETIASHLNSQPFSSFSA